MRKLLWHRMSRPGLTHGLLAASGCVLLGLLLTGCGSTVAASKSTGASATPTCPPVVPTTSISGTIQSISGGSFTIATGSGGSASIHFSGATRFTRQVQTTASALSAGMTVQVTTDSSGVTALRIVITGASGNGARGFGGTRGTPVARGTPAARGNAGCFRRGAGTGVGQGTGSSTGLRGTLTVVSSSQVVLTDSQGQSYTVSVTSSTVIISVTSAQPGDLKVGEPVIALGTTTTGGIDARTVMIELPTTSTS